MTDSVQIQVGEMHYAIEPQHLPPVGTKIIVHKHLCDSGVNDTVEVIGHEWHLVEPLNDKELPTFSISIKTRTGPRRAGAL